MLYLFYRAQITFPREFRPQSEKTFSFFPSWRKGNIGLYLLSLLKIWNFICFTLLSPMLSVGLSAACKERTF